MTNSKYTENLSVSHHGNIKLGKRVSVLSRPVLDSCPVSCSWLDNGCYAERIERRFPNARKAGLKNLKIQDWQKIRSFLLDAVRRKNIVRFHERGDVLKLTSNGSKILDIKYINNIKHAIQSIKKDKLPLPNMWMYTHVYKKEVASLSKFGVSLFASVDNTNDYKTAYKAGFRKFAWSTTLRKGKDKNKKWITENGKTIPVCWEQLNIGKEKSTCDICQYCVKKHLGSIAFMRH